MDACPRLVKSRQPCRSTWRSSFMLLSRTRMVTPELLDFQRTFGDKAARQVRGSFVQSEHNRCRKILLFLDRRGHGIEYVGDEENLSFF